MIAVDFSEGRGRRGKRIRVIAVVATYEHILKSGDFLDSSKWVKHVVDLERYEKTRYLHLLTRRFRSVKPYLTLVKTFNTIDSCNKLINSLEPTVILVDDRLYPYINYPRKIREGNIKQRHRKKLMLLADNIAYYTYWCTAVLGKPEKTRKIDC